MAQLSCNTNSAPINEYVRKVLDTNNVVENAPSTMRYLRNFVMHEEEKQILEEIYRSKDSDWKQEHNHTICKLSACNKNENHLDWERFIIDRAVKANVYPDGYRPECLMVHKYESTAGVPIHDHSDDPAPVHSIVVLGSGFLLDFYDRPPEGKTDVNYKDLYIGSVYLEPRSLFLLSDKAHKNKVHGIRDVEFDEMTDKVYNRPANIPIGTLIPRRGRISIGNSEHNIEDWSKLDEGHI